MEGSSIISRILGYLKGARDLGLTVSRLVGSVLTASADFTHPNEESPESACQVVLCCTGNGGGMDIADVEMHRDLVQ